MKVSILMITYNHEKFIAQAIESVLMQDVDFDYEIVIGEDCSTDHTRDIVTEYEKRYPEKIRVLLSEKNLGMLRNYARTFHSCKGQYIAVLDGDDYWSSPYKLKKQVDFLDAHPETSVCFHKVKAKNDGSSKSFDIGPPDEKIKFLLEDLIPCNFIANCSVMYRAGLVNTLPEWWYTVEMTDWTTHILHAQHGDIGYINEVLGIYRVHPNGVWSMRSDIIKLQEDIKVYDLMNAHLDYVFDKKIKILKSHCCYMLSTLCYENKNMKMARDFAIKSFVTYPLNRKISRTVQVKTLLKFNILYYCEYIKAIIPRCM
jgi:glycosyltransferase involved in cell wall biosynthesis